MAQALAMKRETKMALAVFAAAGLFFLYIALFPPPPAPAGTVNGTYVNPCCQPIRFADGKLYLGDKWIASYVVKRGKRGPYIAPDAAVWVGKDGIRWAQQGPGMFIQYAQNDTLTVIRMPGGDGTGYIFIPEGER